MNFRYKLIQFMNGRYGVDATFYVLFALSAVLSISNIFIRSLILQFLVNAIILFAVFRVFSRNIYARRRENKFVYDIIAKFRKHREFIRRKKADFSHIYKKCPRCHAVLRLPRRKGKHKTVCPKCNNEFVVRVRY